MMDVKQVSLLDIGIVVKLAVDGQVKQLLPVLSVHVLKMVTLRSMPTLNRFVLAVQHTCATINNHGMLILRLPTALLLHIFE